MLQQHCNDLLTVINCTFESYTFIGKDLTYNDQINKSYISDQSSRLPSD